MFTLLPLTSNNIQLSTSSKRTTKNPWQTPTLLAAILTSTLLLTGCQQQSAPVLDNKDSQASEQASAEDNKVAPQSDSTAARIKQVQPLYVAQMQGMQRRLQAEYESLAAADSSDSDSSLLTESEANAEGTNNKASSASDNSDSNGKATNANADEISTAATTDASNSDINSVATEINTSTEIGERDLEVLKRISLEPREPKILTEEQIVERYQQAMQALYQPVSTTLSGQETDTLLNIATLSPQLFEDTEIAERLSVKSPALARLIVQYQVWQQIEAQQSLDMQKMKLTQQQEFEGLMTKFDDTIKGYDEQIAKYEQTLKEFQ